MATIKKAFQPIIDALRANTSLLVEDLLPQIEEMCVAKVGTGGGKATTFHRDEDGNVVAILCYYHKRWLLTADTEFGKKASSASGYSSMSKDGLSKWNKQQAEAKKAEAALLDRVMAGELEPSDIPAAKEEIAQAEQEVIESTSVEQERANYLFVMSYKNPQGSNLSLRIDDQGNLSGNNLEEIANAIQFLQNHIN